MWVMKKTILHLCADIGSDSKPYQDDPEYDVILIGKDIGVENYNPPENVCGVIANPPCTEFSTARANGKARLNDDGMFLVNHCQRIILACNPKFWVIENPARGRLRDFMGAPQFEYEPWWYGSPWTKRTALWGKFNIPTPKYNNWSLVPKNDNLYVRPTRGKPSLAFLHKSAIKHIDEFQCFSDRIHDDMSFRSLCSQNFAKAFYEVNK
jgi:hypothetical protein